MNAHALAATAYSGPAPVRTGRDSEYDIIAKVTRQLISARDAAGFAEIAAALHDNRRLWTVFAADVASPANPLPAALRARIYYLAEFTAQHTQRVLAGDASVDALIDINTAILRGLRHDGGAA